MTSETTPSRKQSLSRRTLFQAGAAALAAPVILGGLSGVGLAATSGGSSSGGAAGASANWPVIGKTRTLGRGPAAMKVSALGFGVMGMNYHRGVHPDKKAMIALLGQAVDHGVTLFDTAEIYGPLTNEELAGEALAPYKGKIAVTTKFGHNLVNGVPDGALNSRPEVIRKSVEGSLRRLKLDVIELYYQHRFDPAVPIEDVAGTIKDLIAEGKVRRFGLCEVGPDAIRRAHAVQPVTAVQSEYHLMWREPETTIFPVLDELGIGFVPYSPLNRGLLGGDMTEYTRFDSGNDNRDILPRFAPEALRKNLMFVEMLNRFARPRGLTGAQAALAWMMAKKDWIVPIPGTTKLSHLEENLRAADVNCTAQEWAELETTLAPVAIVGDRYPAALQSNIQR